jgi:hypothetical protein
MGPMTGIRTRLALLATVAIVLLTVCEAVLLWQYVGAMQRTTELSVELEYVRGAAMMAQAQAQRCSSRPE